MHANQSVDAFHFHDDTVLYHKVWAMFSYQVSFVVDGYACLSNKGYVLIRELETQGLLVSSFHQTRPELPMNLHSAPNDPVCEGVVLIKLRASVPRCVVIRRRVVIRRGVS